MTSALVERAKDAAGYARECGQILNPSLLDELASALAAKEAEIAALKLEWNELSLAMERAEKAAGELAEQNDELSRIADFNIESACLLQKRAESAEARLATIRQALEPLREMEKRATPGPWRFEDRSDNQLVVSEHATICALAGITSHSDDFILIAALRNLLWLVPNDAAGEE